MSDKLFDGFTKIKVVNYGELSCVLGDYLATDGVILKTAITLESMTDDILKLVNDCSYPSKEAQELLDDNIKADDTIEKEWRKSQNLQKQIDLLVKCEEIEGVDEMSVFCYCQGCKNKELLKGVKE